MQPCLDDFHTTFDDYAEMQVYHARQARESKWARKTVSGLHIEPLDEASPLYTDGKAFAPNVSQVAVNDTAKNLGLALLTENGYLPIRNTAYKSLLDRAKIGGSALPKLQKPKLAGILNECLSLHKSEALLLVRSEKVAAFHSGDERDYSILPIDELMTSLSEKLNERFPGNIFAQGYADHSLATASWSFPAQRDELLETYDKALISHGQKHLASKFTPGVRLQPQMWALRLRLYPLCLRADSTLYASAMWYRCIIGGRPRCGISIPRWICSLPSSPTPSKSWKACSI